MSIAALIRRMSEAGAPDEVVIAAAIEEAERREAPRALLPVRRMSTRERGAAFDALCNRDGANCVECGAEHRYIWRTAGVWSSADWPADEPWLLAKYTKVNRSSNLEVDHRTALHSGGTNDLDNLWLLCRECHKIKSAREQSERLKSLFEAARK